ncbi:MAG: DUF2213 domain-containing protein [Thalassolituus sp.]
MPEQLRLVTQVNSERIQRTADGYLIRDAVPVVDDVVMNGGLYPSAEISTSYQSMSGVPAPIGHPEDDSGAFISASNGEGLRKYYAGATCENVRYEGGRVLMDVAINERQALAHPDGERLIAALNGSEPVHLSTGLLLQREEAAGNSKGKEYTWVARNMSFDHVAILLDQPGAATPDDGVGMWVNVDRETATNGMSAEEKREVIEKALRGKHATPGKEQWLWIAQTYDDYVVYESDDQYYQIDYSISSTGAVELKGEPVKVKRRTTFTPVGNAMKKILDRLGEMVATAVPAGYTDPTNVINADNGGENEMTPEEIQELVGNAVKAAVAPLADELKTVKADMAANAEAQKATLVEQAATASGIEANALKGMTEDGLKALIAKHSDAAGVPSGYQANGAEPETYDMPE